MSGPEIDFNKLGDDASIHAGYELESAAKVLAVTLGEPERNVIRKYQTLVVGHALLAQIDALAQEIRLLSERSTDTPKPVEQEKSIFCQLLSRFKKVAGL